MEFQVQRVASRRGCLRAQAELPVPQVIASCYAMVPGVDCKQGILVCPPIQHCSLNSEIRGALSLQSLAFDVHCLCSIGKNITDRRLFSER